MANRGPARGEQLFSDIAQEYAPRPLAIEGRIPPWLRGTYVRNGPARFSFLGTGGVAHWFDGMAYLQAFHFESGALGFNARFVRSNAYEAALAGRRPFEAFGTAPTLSPHSFFGRLFGGNFTDNPNVNIARYGDRHVALTEVGLPRCFDPVTLETLSSYVFNDAIGTGYTTAHPAFVGGRWINYTLKFGPTSRYIVWSMGADGRRTELTTIRTKRPAYIHSIGVSERFAILIEYPYTVNALALAFGHRPFIDNFRWDGNASSLFHVIDLQDGSVVTCAGEAFYSFHHIHAFDDGADVVVDLVGYDDATVVGDLTIANLRDGATMRKTGMGVRRYRLSPRTRTATRGDIAEQSLRLELPRINPHAGAKPRYYYGPRFTETGFASDGLFRVDVANGGVRVWERPNEAPGEAVFVARPGATQEDDGVLLTVVHHYETHASAIVVLDGASFDEIGRASVGVPLPLGFHGQFYKEIL